MNSRSLISKFVAQLCEKQYSFANSTLASIVEAKMKSKIKKEVEKLKGSKDKKKKDVKKGKKKNK